MTWLSDRWAILAACLLTPGFLSAGPCTRSVTSYSQYVMSIDVNCTPVIRSNAVRLNCHHYRQTTRYTCGPAAVMVLMSCYGLLSANELNHETELRIAAEMGTVKDVGTTQSQMAAWLKNKGFYVSMGEGITSDMIIDNINSGIPTLVGFGNHWILAEGYHPGEKGIGEELIFVDPDFDINLMSGSVIDSMWTESRFSVNKASISPGIYIVAVPRKK